MKMAKKCQYLAKDIFNQFIKEILNWGL